MFIVALTKQELTISCVVISTWFLLEFCSISSHVDCPETHNQKKWTEGTYKSSIKVSISTMLHSKQTLSRSCMATSTGSHYTNSIKVSVSTMLHSKQTLTRSCMATSTGFLSKFSSIFSSCFPQKKNLSRFGLWFWNTFFLPKSSHLNNHRACRIQY